MTMTKIGSTNSASSAAKILSASVLALSLLCAALQRNALWYTEAGLLRDTITKSPQKERVNYNLGSVLAKEGSYDEALDMLLTAARLKPDRSETHNQLGGIYLMKSNYPAAVAEFRIAVSLAGDNVEAQYNLACALDYSGKTREAVPYYRNFIALAKDGYPEQVASAKRIIAHQFGPR